MSKHHSGSAGHVLPCNPRPWSFPHHGTRGKRRGDSHASELEVAQEEEERRNIGTMQQAQMVMSTLQDEETAIKYVSERAQTAAAKAVTWYRDEDAQGLSQTQTVTLALGLSSSQKIGALQALNHARTQQGVVVTLQQQAPHNLVVCFDAMISSPGATFLPLSVTLTRNSHFLIPGLVNAHAHLVTTTTDETKLDFSEPCVASGGSGLLPPLVSTRGDTLSQEVVLYQPGPGNVATQDLLRGLRYDKSDLKRELDELRRLTNFIYETTQRQERKGDSQTPFTRAGKAPLMAQDEIWIPEDLEAFSNVFADALQAQTPDEKGRLAVDIRYNYLAYTVLRHLVPVIADKNAGTVFQNMGPDSEDSQLSMKRYTVVENNLRYWRFSLARLKQFMENFLKQRRCNALNLPALELQLSANALELASWQHQLDRAKGSDANKLLSGVMYVQVTGVVLDDIQS